MLVLTAEILPRLHAYLVFSALLLSSAEGCYAHPFRRDNRKESEDTLRDGLYFAYPGSVHALLVIQELSCYSHIEIDFQNRWLRWFRTVSNSNLHKSARYTVIYVLCTTIKADWRKVNCSVCSLH